MTDTLEQDDVEPSSEECPAVHSRRALLAGAAGAAGIAITSVVAEGILGVDVAQATTVTAVGCEYVMTWDGTTAQAINGHNNNVDYSGSDWATVWNQMIAHLNGLTVPGGKVRIQKSDANNGVILISTTLNTCPNLSVDGGGAGVVLQAKSSFTSGTNGSNMVDAGHPGAAVGQFHLDDVTLDCNGGAAQNGILAYSGAAVTSYITRCSISGFGTAGIALGKIGDATGSSDVWVSHCVIGPGATGSHASIDVYDGDAHILWCNLYQGGSYGVYIDGASTVEVKFCHCVIKSSVTTGAPVWVAGAQNTVLMGNYLDNVSNAFGGITLMGTTSHGSILKTRILGNHFNMNSANPAIYVDDAAAISMNNLLISDNNIAGNASPFTPEIVQFNSVPASLLTSCLIEDNTGNNVTTIYSLSGTSTGTPASIESNVLGNSASMTYGVASFAGTLTKVITHNLIAAPSVVLVTPSADRRAWVTAISATQFTINLSAVLTGPVYWRASI
ncbi:MAG: hypothetical protein QOE83_5 [Actinomycetota bacterium]|jgi:hypothetical protein|nr:hypothetical protein [Actinomycetota bacterium]